MANWKWLVILILTTMNACAGLSKLEALSMIESGDDDWAVGRFGEVSRFQIRPQVWRQYSQSSAFANQEVASTVARKHIDHIEALFRSRTGRDATDFDFYVIWNAGFAYYERLGFAPDRVSSVIRNRANRYLNLRTMPEAQRVLYVSRVQLNMARPARF